MNGPALLALQLIEAELDQFGGHGPMRVVDEQDVGGGVVITGGRSHTAGSQISAIGPDVRPRHQPDGL